MLLHCTLHLLISHSQRTYPLSRQPSCLTRTGPSLPSFFSAPWLHSLFQQAKVNIPLSKIIRSLSSEAVSPKSFASPGVMHVGAPQCVSKPTFLAKTTPRDLCTGRRHPGLSWLPLTLNSWPLGPFCGWSLGLYTDLIPTRSAAAMFGESFHFWSRKHRKASSTSSCTYNCLLGSLLLICWGQEVHDARQGLLAYQFPRKVPPHSYHSNSQLRVKFSDGGVLEYCVFQKLTSRLQPQ